MGAQKSKLTPTDIKDLANHTDFTEEEIQVWFKSFRKDCPTGRLTLVEFKKLYKSFFPNGDATAFAQHAFRTFDNNEDGTIDFREFMTSLSIMSRGTFNDKLGWAFSMYDQDKNGFVTKKEMLEIIMAIYKMVGEESMKQVVTDGLSPQQRVDRLFERIDKNKDEKITLEEFKKAAAEDPNLVMLLQISSNSS